MTVRLWNASLSILSNIFLNDNASIIYTLEIWKLLVHKIFLLEDNATMFASTKGAVKIHSLKNKLVCNYQGKMI